MWHFARELPAYLTAVAGVAIDHSEGKEDHSFTNEILLWWEVNGAKFPAWAEAAQIVFAFTPNSAAAERVFSVLTAQVDVWRPADGDAGRHHSSGSHVAH